MSDELFLVYIAGPLSDMPPQYLANVSRMSDMSRLLTERGFTTINPAADMLEGLMGAKPWPLELYHERSMNHLRLLQHVRGAMLVLDDHHADGRVSKGVRAEMDEAYRLGIPVTDNVDGLMAIRAEWVES